MQKSSLKNPGSSSSPLPNSTNRIDFVFYGRSPYAPPLHHHRVTQNIDPRTAYKDNAVFKDETPPAIQDIKEYIKSINGTKSGINSAIFGYGEVGAKLGEKVFFTSSIEKESGTESLQLALQNYHDSENTLICTTQTSLSRIMPSSSANNLDTNYQAANCAFLATPSVQGLSLVDCTFSYKVSTEKKINLRDTMLSIIFEADINETDLNNYKIYYMAADWDRNQALEPMSLYLKASSEEINYKTNHGSGGLALAALGEKGEVISDAINKQRLQYIYDGSKEALGKAIPKDQLPNNTLFCLVTMAQKIRDRYGIEESEIASNRIQNAFTKSQTTAKVDEFINVITNSLATAINSPAVDSAEPISLAFIGHSASIEEGSLLHMPIMQEQIFAGAFVELAVLYTFKSLLSKDINSLSSDIKQGLCVSLLNYLEHPLLGITIDVEENKNNIQTLRNYLLNLKPLTDSAAISGIVDSLIEQFLAYRKSIAASFQILRRINSPLILWKGCQRSLLSSEPNINSLCKQLETLDTYQDCFFILSKQARTSEEGQKKKAITDSLFQEITSIRTGISAETNEKKKDKRVAQLNKKKKEYFTLVQEDISEKTSEEDRSRVAHNINNEKNEYIKLYHFILEIISKEFNLPQELNEFLQKLSDIKGTDTRPFVRSFISSVINLIESCLNSTDKEKIEDFFNKSIANVLNSIAACYKQVIALNLCYALKEFFFESEFSKLRKEISQLIAELNINLIFEENVLESDESLPKESSSQKWEKNKLTPVLLKYYLSFDKLQQFCSSEKFSNELKTVIYNNNKYLNFILSSFPTYYQGIENIVNLNLTIPTINDTQERFCNFFPGHVGAVTINNHVLYLPYIGSQTATQWLRDAYGFVATCKTTRTQACNDLKSIYEARLQIAHKVTAHIADTATTPDNLNILLKGWKLSPWFPSVMLVYEDYSLGFPPKKELFCIQFYYSMGGIFEGPRIIQKPACLLQEADLHFRFRLKNPSNNDQGVTFKKNQDFLALLIAALDQSIQLIHRSVSVPNISPCLPLIGPESNNLRKLDTCTEKALIGLFFLCMLYTTIFLPLEEEKIGTAQVYMRHLALFYSSIHQKGQTDPISALAGKEARSQFCTNVIFKKSATPKFPVEEKIKEIADTFPDNPDTFQELCNFYRNSKASNETTEAAQTSENNTGNHIAGGADADPSDWYKFKPQQSGPEKSDSVTQAAHTPRPRASTLG